MKPQDFHGTIATLLGEKLKPLVQSGRTLNLVACVEVYTTIFETLVSVVEETNSRVVPDDADDGSLHKVTLDVSNEGMNYLAQCYYDGVLVNGTQELDPDIFTQRAKLENISTEELTLLAVMLNGTDFCVPVLEEVKKRS